MKRIAFSLLLLQGCAESDEARLDHAQILAVRSEPAHVAPGERARIDILAGDDAGTVFETAPDSVTAIGARGPLPVEHTPEGWFVTATEPDAVTLVVTLTIDGIERPASKSLVVAERAENPAVAMTIAGAPAMEMTAQVGTTTELEVAAEGTEPFTYAWYSSVGDLTYFRSATARLEAVEPAEGTLLVVVRDDVGGVSWLQVPARVE
jgi:hypothetical protein